MDMRPLNDLTVSRLSPPSCLSRIKLHSRVSYCCKEGEYGEENPPLGPVTPSRCQSRRGSGQQRQQQQG
jgi:hypothetical protein